MKWWHSPTTSHYKQTANKRDTNTIQTVSSNSKIKSYTLISSYQPTFSISYPSHSINL